MFKSDPHSLRVIKITPLYQAVLVRISDLINHFWAIYINDSLMNWCRLSVYKVFLVIFSFNLLP